MSSLQFFIDATSRHAVFVQRYSAGIERIAGKRIDSLLREAAQVAEKATLIEDVLTVLDYKKINNELLEYLDQFTDSELNFYTEMLRTGTTLEDINKPPVETVRNKVNSNFMSVTPGRSITIAQAFRNFATRKTNQVGQLMRDGFLTGASFSDLAKGILKLIPLQKNQLRSVVRTANNSMSTMAAFELFRSNLDVIDGYKWVSTLDGRTTFVCMARDGRNYPISPSSPTPPAHWACRSVIVPRIDPRYDLASNVDGERPSETGEVSTKTTYGSWLKKQSKEFQDEALGPERAKLFRSGAISIDGFVDPTGKVYNLQQLEAINNLSLN